MKCLNGGIKVNISQNYYVCSEDRQSNDSNCPSEIATNEVCYCPEEFSGFDCSLRAFTMCYVNITEPALYEGCNSADSEDYVFSIAGYDPCNFYDFDNDTITISYRLQC